MSNNQTTEVKKSLSGNLGLFAGQKFQPGDVILEEAPIIVLDGSDSASSSKKDSSSKKSSSSAENNSDGVIVPPTSVDAKFHGTFRGMVQAGMSWIDDGKEQRDESKTKTILDFYYPNKETTNRYERSLLEVLEGAIGYIKRQEPDYTDYDEVEKVMLIYACNAFQGGRIYPEISRVNHSCNPNAIIKVVTKNDSDDNGEKSTEETQQVIAVASIGEGEEICISYLGSLLYTDKDTRNMRLQTTKFFECACERCSNSNEDFANQIPCPECHPRQSPQFALEEDVQYDDDQQVQYVIPGSTTKPLTKSGKPFTAENNPKLLKAMSTVTSKIVSYLESQENKTSKTSPVADSKNGNDAEEEDDILLLEEHVSLASTIMGDKHWTTNLMLLLHLDRRLSNMSTAMLTQQELPEMEDIAEAIDSLQRLCRFVDGLNLKLHMGHLLGDVIIGIARTLVSLGDTKSQKYGSEWLHKISDDYVVKFESDGRQKVVTALSNAWKKHGRESLDGEDHNDNNKKMKSK